MESNYKDYEEKALSLQREFEHEQEKLTEKMEQLEEHLQLMSFINDLIAENKKLSQENEALKSENIQIQEKTEVLQQQLEDEKKLRAEEKKLRAELEMKMAEMSKLSAALIKKASQEEMANAFRAFANVSKRKTLSKRSSIKMMIMEFSSIAKFEMPEDLELIVESLDDETPEAKTVTQNIIYPQPGSTANVGCEMKQPEFKVIEAKA
jgi:hypothetical protein